MKTPIDWDIVVESLGPKLYRYFYGRFEPIVADDLTQETLVRLVDKVELGGFDTSRGTLDMFAFGIARFVRLEELGRKTHLSLADGQQEFLADSQDFVSELENLDDLALLRQAMAQLGEPEQEIVLLTVDQEWSLAKIADHMDMPLGTVKSHVHRAKKNILQFINNKIGGRDEPRI